VDALDRHVVALANLQHLARVGIQNDLGRTRIIHADGSLAALRPVFHPIDVTDIADVETRVMGSRQAKDQQLSDRKDLLDVPFRLLIWPFPKTQALTVVQIDSRERNDNDGYGGKEAKPDMRSKQDCRGGSPEDGDEGRNSASRARCRLFYWLAPHA
jgi:hypothetical protein